MASKTKKLKILGWVGLVVALLASLMAVTFAWYSDKKEADMNITVSGASGEATINEQLSPEDLIAGNSFVKSISVKLNSKSSVYFRAYATVVMQTLDSAGQTITKTDIISNIGVNSTIIGQDNKYYYSTTNENSLTSVMSGTYNLQFAFFVNPSINDEILRDTNGNLKTDLTTTITYHIEYCQEENFDDWGSITTNKTSYLIVWKNSDRVLKVDFLQAGETPVYGGANPTKPATDTVEYTFSAFSPTIAQVTEGAEYTATFTETSFVATFDTNWKTQITSFGITGISALTDITGIRFDSPKTLPSEYQNTNKAFSSKIRIYQSASTPTNLAFVFGTINAPTNCSYLFSDSASSNQVYLTNLLTLTFNNFNTSNVTSMNNMFQGCSGLTSLDVSGFDTSKVTTMSSMFQGCSGLASLDVSNFNTANVTNMYAMFYNCSGLTSLNVLNFDTSKVTNMAYMFAWCSKLTSLDVSNFNTSSVTSMAYMFYNCSKLTSIDVSNFNTSKVGSMEGMFRSCSSLTSLDLSSFNTSSVTTWTDMFSGTFSNAPSSSSLKISSNFTYKVGGVNTQFASKTELNSKTALNTSVTVLKDGNALS